MTPHPEFIPHDDEFDHEPRRVPWELAELCHAEEPDFDPLGPAKGIILAVLIVLACAFIVVGCWDAVQGAKP